MEGWKKLKDEVIKLNTIAFYSALTNALDYGFMVVDLAMLGHLGKGQLASGIVGYAVYNIIWHFIEGVLSAQDTLVSRAFAQSYSASARYWSYISLFVVLALCTISTILFFFSPWIIEYGFSVKYHVSSKAAQHIMLMLPALWCHGIYRVMQKYLQPQNIMAPALISCTIGILANLLGIVCIVCIVCIRGRECVRGRECIRGRECV